MLQIQKCVFNTFLTTLLTKTLSIMALLNIQLLAFVVGLEHFLMVNKNANT